MSKAATMHWWTYSDGFEGDKKHEWLTCSCGFETGHYPIENWSLPWGDMAEHLIDVGLLTRQQAGDNAYKGYSDSGANPLWAFRCDGTDKNRRSARLEFGIEYPDKPPAGLC